MPRALADHVARHMRLRDDLFVWGVYAPCAALALFVLAVLWVVCAPVDWFISRRWRPGDPHPIHRGWRGW